MRTLAFVRANLGRVVQAPAGFGGQCVDLANIYLLDVWAKPEIHANAVDWQSARIQGMTWEPNGPANHPPLGSIVVWRPYAPHGIGIFGHIAIALTADAMDLVTFDQNWAEGSPCAFVLHDYGGVAGWHRPAG
jgi:hypothetical protein